MGHGWKVTIRSHSELFDAQPFSREFLPTIVKCFPEMHDYDTENKVRGANMLPLLRKLRQKEEGQDIAEYAVMLAVILVLVVGTIRLIGTSANNVFSATASSIGQ